MKGIGRVSRMCPRGIAAGGGLLFAALEADPEVVDIWGVVDNCFMAGPKSSGCNDGRWSSSVERLEGCLEGFDGAKW